MSVRVRRSMNFSCAVCGVPSRIDPELLVQAARFDDQRIALPAADRVAVVGRGDVLGKRTAVEIDDPVRVRPAVVHDVHPLQFGHLDELGAVGRRELSRHARSLAPGVGFELIDLPDVVDRAGPRLKRNRRELSARQAGHAGAPSTDRLARHGTQNGLAVGPARRRRRRWRGTSSTTAAGRRLLGLRGNVDESHRQKERNAASDHHHGRLS